MAKAMSLRPEMLEVAGDHERVLLFRCIDEPGCVLWFSTRLEAEHGEQFEAFADGLQFDFDMDTQ